MADGLVWIFLQREPPNERDQVRHRLKQISQVKVHQSATTCKAMLRFALHRKLLSYLTTRSHRLKVTRKQRFTTETFVWPGPNVADYVHPFMNTVDHFLMATSIGLIELNWINTSCYKEKVFVKLSGLPPDENPVEDCCDVEEQKIGSMKLQKWCDAVMSAWSKTSSTSCGIHAMKSCSCFEELLSTRLLVLHKYKSSLKTFLFKHYLIYGEHLVIFTFL